MEDKPKLEPLRLADWAHNSAFFAKDVQLLSEKKPSRTVRLNPIPPSQLNLSFQVLKPSVGRTPARSATSIKKKGWNSSVKVGNKERKITEIKPHIRKTLNFTSKLMATDARRNVADNKTLLIQKLAMSKEEKKRLDSTEELKISGIKRIPVTPPSQGIVPTNLQIMTPKGILKMKLMNDSHFSTPSPKSCDSDETFLHIEKKIDDNIVKGNEKDVNIALPTSNTPLKSNILEYFLKTDTDSHNKDKSISNQSENEYTIVSLCDAFKKALISNSYKKIDTQKEQASLISVIETVQNYLQDFEEEKTINSKGNKSGNQFVNKFKKKSLKNTHLSSTVEKKDALNVYIGIKNGLTFLDTPKTNTTRSNEMDTPARMKKNLQSQINKLYSEDEF